MDDYEQWMENLARVFEGIGVAIIALGAVYALVTALADRPGRQLFAQTRRHFGQPFILGLEVLVAADIIETITVDPSLESVTALGILVLIRVVLSLSLDMEVEGMMPWRRAEFEAAHQESEE